MKAAGVAIRAVRGSQECEAVSELCAGAFPEEARATGMPIKKWRDLKTEDLVRSPELWRQCGARADPLEYFSACARNFAGRED
jgi:hypothetical protein